MTTKVVKPPYPESSKIAFIKQLYCPARIVAAETGCSWELIIAQAAQETGWGEKTLPGTNNVFNIKAFGGWTGPSKEFTVWEKVRGVKVWVVAPFRVYPSIAASLRDRTEFLRKNQGYARAGLFDPGTKGDFFKEATALKKAGYATDEKYVQLLTDVWNGRTMRRAIEAAKKDGCAAVLPAIEIFFKDGARVPIAKAKISMTMGERNGEAETDAAGSFVIKLTPAMSGVVVKLKIFDAIKKVWIDLDPVTIPAPVTSSTVTLLAPTFTVPTSTRVHDKVPAAAATPAVAAAAPVPASAPAVKATAPAPVAPAPAAMPTEIYKIAKGDTLASIAAACKTRYKTIADLNNIASPYIIRPDQLIRVPLKSHAAPAAGPPAPHAPAAQPPASHAPASHAAAPAPPAANAPQAAPSDYATELHAVYYRDKADKPKTDVMNSMRSPWMQYAEEEFKAKVKRIAGQEAHAHIIDYFKVTDLNKKMASTDETAWCAAFCNWCLVKAGFKGDNSAGAAMFKNWGRPTRDNKPALGAVALIRFKSGKYHVCFVAGVSKNGKQLATLGGNQGDNSAVTHSHVPIDWVVCYRYPSNYHDYDDDYVLHDIKTDGAPLTSASTHS